MFTWLMVPFALLLVSVLWCAGGAIAHVKSAIFDYRLHLNAGAVAAAAVAVRSKVVAMTVLGLAMACWIAVLQLRKLRCVFHVARKPPSVIGNGGGSPGAGSDNCWHCF